MDGAATDPTEAVNIAEFASTREASLSTMNRRWEATNRGRLTPELSARKSLHESAHDADDPRAPPLHSSSSDPEASSETPFALPTPLEPAEPEPPLDSTPSASPPWYRDALVRAIAFLVGVVVGRFILRLKRKAP